MARVNKRSVVPANRTHEGAIAAQINPKQQLERVVMASLLWEDSFYMDGVSSAQLIADCVANVPPEFAASVARRARDEMKLRHVPLWIARTLALSPKVRGTGIVANLLRDIIKRPDELTEFLALYWKDGRQPLSAQVKKGLAAAFTKFDEYQLAKYNRDAAIKLRDVLFLSHAKPKDDAQAQLWKRLVAGELAIPDTWEVALSAGENKRATWERLIRERKLGALALLRNLRNMESAGVGREIILQGLSEINTRDILPFRFLSALKYAPKFADAIEKAMLSSIATSERLPGKTVLLIDKSGSMSDLISAKSELSRLDAARGLAILLREICDDVVVFTFDWEARVIPSFRGLALASAIPGPGGGTQVNAAKMAADAEGYDRVIIITDEQSHDRLTPPNGAGYVVNVGAYKHGVGYGSWCHVDGWSESIVNFIQAYEKQNTFEAVEI